MFNEELLKYFDGDELACSVYLQKYALRNENDEVVEPTIDLMFKRIASEFARIQKKKYRNTKQPPISYETIYDLMYNRYILPQGSPLFGIGNDYQTVSLANCFVIHPPQDSYGSILQTDEELVQLSKRRGGVGTDLSHLRPKGHPTRNAAKTSTGITSFMERYSNSINEVGQSGRRGALMLSLSCFSKDTEILTNEGWMNVVDVVDKVDNNEEIFALDDQSIPHLIKNPVVKEPEPIYEIETEDGSILEVTADHKFEVKNIKTNEVYLKALKDIDIELEYITILSQN